MPEELTKYLLSSTPSLFPKLNPGASYPFPPISGNDSQESPWYCGVGARAPRGVFTGATGAQHREAEGGEDQGPAVEAHNGHSGTTEDDGGVRRG